MVVVVNVNNDSKDEQKHPEYVFVLPVDLPREGRQVFFSSPLIFSTHSDE